MATLATRSSGESFIYPARLARLARCVNISRWFRYCASESANHFLGYITDADLDLLVQLGVTGIRLTVAADQIIWPPHADRPDPQRLGYVQFAISRFLSRELATVLVIHDVPRRIETEAGFADAFVRFWGNLATDLREINPEFLFLEPMNEPVFDSAQSRWFTLEKRLVDVIRCAAPEHTLILGGTNYSGIDGLVSRTPIADANAVYTFHFYEPFAFTHQGAPWVSGWIAQLENVPYPLTRERLKAAFGETSPTYRALWPPQDFGRAAMQNRVRLAAEWGERHRAPVWAGEFGCFPRYAPRQDVLNWFFDVRKTFECHGIGWAVWSYDEELGLNRKRQTGSHIRIDREIADALGFSASDAAHHLA